MTKIKICGLSRPQDIEAANALAPEYIGFVFAESRRKIAPADAERLRKSLAPGIAAVGVFVNETPQQVAALLHSGIIDMAQLHGDEDAAYIAALRALTAAPIIRAVPVGRSLPPLPVEADYLLFDTASQQRGGTGQPFNWKLLQGYTGKPYFLAGGLHSGNVAAAVAALHPFAVDVSSGVETDGLKDPQKMAQFLGLVRGQSQNGGE